MMVIQGGLTREKLLHEVQSAIESAREKAEYNYQRFGAGEATTPQRAADLSYRLDGRILASVKVGTYDGAMQFVLYAADGQELARTQLAYGTATPLEPDDTWDTWRIWLDPVLSPEEQLDFAHLLLENPLLSFADGFLYDQSQTSEDAFCQIVGVADEQRHVLYPKTITYIYPDRETCILDSNSSFFHNKELTTMQFQSIGLFSGLTEMGPSPEQALRYWQQAGERAEAMYQGYPDSYETAVTSNGSACISLEDGSVLVCGCFYELTFLILEELKSTALYTLLAAIAIALYTDHRQRQALQRERDFARAAAHELKTPLAVLRAHTEALREDIAPEKREEYLANIGYMPQHFGFYPHYTVYEFLEYMSILKNQSKEYGRKRIDELLKILHLEDKRKTKMKQLSGGMLRRVGIAQALLNQPEILILDEPTAGLDPKERIIFRNLIASLSQECIVLLSTHIVSDIETIADDIIVMKEAKIILHDTPRELLLTMEEKVWQVTLPKKEALALMASHIVVKSHNVEDDIELRIVADECPHSSAQNLSPDLDDLYLYYFKEGDSL